MKKLKIKSIFDLTQKSQRIIFLVVVILNVILLSCVFLFYGEYISKYKEKLLNENLSNIANMNQASAQNAKAFIGSWDIKLDDTAKYLETHDMTYDEALAFISDTNSEDDRCFQLIGSDYTGHIAKRNQDNTFTAITYENGSYLELQKAFNDVDDDDYEDICFAPEFTDNYTANKFFAVYKHLTLKVGGVDTVFTLLLATKSSNVLSEFNTQSDYEGQSTVLVDARGNYIVRNNDFKSTNFFSYLYTFNDLSLDEKLAIEEEMSSKNSGELYFKNAGTVVEDCVYSYERMSTNGWYCITCVPISSFHASVFDTNLVVVAVILLIMLLFVDVSWLLVTNRRLRVGIARETNANNAKGMFMSRMSHEIRTPLNALIGYNAIAISDIESAKTEEEHRQADVKVADCLTKSAIASKHLLTVINDVLDMAAVESGRMKVNNELFDFKTLITSITTIFHSQAKAKKVDFEVIFDTLVDEWFIGDQIRTNQILTNLLSNAVKFTNEGGTVKLKLSQQKNPHDDSALLHFEVIDTGIGMSEEYLEHLWTPFEQADSSISRRFGGTGLGLSITKSLIELMNGSIDVKSQLDVGTTFTVELTFKHAVSNSKIDVYDFSKINALIIDDDAYTSEYITQLFELCRAKCSTVSSIEKDEKHTLCFVDWKMAKDNGLDSIKKIKSISGKNVPLIVMIYDSTEINDEVIAYGIDKVISKPLFKSSLFDLLADLSGDKKSEHIEKSVKFNFAGKRILLAEDNAMNMEIARRILESANFNVDCAWNGDEAVKAFSSKPQGTYSAILMDVHMPVIDGLSASRLIRGLERSDAKDIPIIAMTADAFAENVAETRSSGMNEHISKPIDVQLLFETLKKYCKS